MRKLLVLLILLILLAIGADVLARRTAEEQIADRLRRTFDLSSEPGVSVKGIPFLLRLFEGDIPKIVMRADDVRSDDLTLEEVELEMRRVRFSIGDVVEGSGRVSVQGGRGTALVTEAHLNDALADAGAPFVVSITSGGVRAGSGEAGKDISGDVRVEGGSLTVTVGGAPPVSLDLPTLGGRITYESVSFQEGATLSLTVGRLSLTG